MVQNKLPLINSAHGSETRNIINEIIKTLNGLGYTYDQSLQMARNILNEAQRTNDMNAEVNKRLDNIIASSGTSSTEVVDARGGHATLRGHFEATKEKISDVLSFKVTNLITNSDFSDGLTGWSKIGAPTIASDGSVAFSASNSNPQVFQTLNLTADNIYYIGLKAKVLGYSSGTLGYHFEGRNYGYTSNTSGYVTLSNVHEYKGGSQTIQFGALGASTLNGNIDEIIVVDLTASFGAGNEPSAETFEGMFEGHFTENAEVSINAKGLYLNSDLYGIAIGDSKARQIFMNEVNNLAKRFKMSQSHFVNPYGWNDDGHVSSANDLLRLGMFAAEYPEMIKVWSKASYTFKVKGNNERSLTLESTVYDDALNNVFQIVGGKTGTANYINSLISVVEDGDGGWLVGVVQGDRLSRFAASVEIYNIAKSELRKRRENNALPQNKISNGDFYNGLDRWTIAAGAPSIVSGRLSVNSTGNSAQVKQTISVVQGHKYYMSADINVTRWVTGVLGFTTPRITGAANYGFMETTSGTQKRSVVLTGASSGASDLIVGGINAANLDGTIDNIVVVDLTDYYGEGNEPTLEEFEAFGYDYKTKPQTNYNIMATNAAVALKPPNALAYEDKSFDVLYAKNSMVDTIPASTTKVISVLTALENTTDLDEIIEIKSSDIVSDGIVLHAGDKMSIRDALHCMMLPSSNIASMAVARHVGEKIAKRNLIN